ncbi:MAG: type II toxin-antitoxin system RelB/DinJ family antitoxin [Firmicutes bacterium]|nr:type II toxin-antitoxin system RelB/DinJ family antitoxin [Bacillota bacterium]
MYHAKEGFAVAETTNLSIRMDRELKEQAEQLFSELGMNMTTAFNIFVRQAVRQGKIPFEISLNIPNAETIAAMEEANKMSRDPKAKRYSSFEELVAEIQNEV